MVNLFIAGFSKCGTTSLFNSLINHKDIGCGTSKEPSYFSKLNGFTNTKNYDDWSVGGNYFRGINWYDEIFKNRTNNIKYKIDASTIYSFDSDSPRLIHNYNPNSKIIFIVREPYKRIESHYFQEVKNGMKLPKFDKFIVSEHPRLNFYKKVTNYKSTILRYIDIFGNNNVYVTSLNEIKDNPEVVFSEILNFLKIEEYDFNQLLKRESKNMRKSPRFRYLKSLFIGIERSKLARHSPRFVQEFGSSIMRHLDRLLLKEIDNKIKISENIRNEINDEFKEDTDYLKNIHNISI